MPRDITILSPHVYDQLDLATHELFYDMFDRANLTALQHLGKMIERGPALEHAIKPAINGIHFDLSDRTVVPVALDQHR